MGGGLWPQARDHAMRCEEWGNQWYFFLMLGNPDPDATGYDWKAMLEMKDGQKKCVEEALRSAGGPKHLKCGGNAS